VTTSGTQTHCVTQGKGDAKGEQPCVDSAGCRFGPKH
jgi:hypothetical protein